LRIPLEKSQVTDGEKVRSLLDDQTFVAKDGFLEVKLPPKGFCYLDWSSKGKTA
jgi:hypothetical protein